MLFCFLCYLHFIEHGQICYVLYLFQLEDAAKEVADEITRPRPEGEEEVEDIQVMLTSASNACGIRELKVRYQIWIVPVENSKLVFAYNFVIIS